MLNHDSPLNSCAHGNKKNKFNFYSGDWLSFSSNSSHNFNREESELLFDTILTSETIYNPDNYEKLISVFDSCLEKNGQMYPFIFVFFLKLLIFFKCFIYFLLIACLFPF